MCDTVVNLDMAALAFKKTKKLAEEVDFLSPYNQEKELYLQTDGSKTGLGYLLYQQEDGPPPPPAKETDD